MNPIRRNNTTIFAKVNLVKGVILLVVIGLLSLFSSLKIDSKVSSYFISDSELNQPILSPLLLFLTWYGIPHTGA